MGIKDFMSVAMKIDNSDYYAQDDVYLDFYRDEKRRQDQGGGGANNKILSQRPDVMPSRPWMVHLKIIKDSLMIVECSGSLLNRRWFISAAHCFCGSAVRCTSDKTGFKKQFRQGEPDFERIAAIEVEFGTYASNAKPLHRIQELHIHPDYAQVAGDTVLGPGDVALVKTQRPVFGRDALGPSPPPLGPDGVQPICLPPRPNFRMDPSTPGADPESTEPLEDMDCFYEKGQNIVPYPHHTARDGGRGGWLTCHPEALTHGHRLSISGRTSYITAYGSTSRQDVDLGPVRYQCLTNSYGPPGSTYEFCKGRCHKSVTTDIRVKLNGQVVTGRFANPSLAHPLCQQFVRSASWPLAQQLHKQAGTGGGGGGNGSSSLDDAGAAIDPTLHALTWIRLEDPLTGTNVTCYPESRPDVLADAASLWDRPFRHGWCTVCQKGLVEDCMPGQDEGWGWCLPECDESNLQPDIHRTAHEAVVDAFVYENCSKGVDTRTEFCTGVPVTRSLGQIWQVDTSGEFARAPRFLFRRHQLRQFRMDSTWNGNGTIIRPGAQYQGAQHTQAIGDACYGDAGGSVWKFYNMRGVGPTSNRTHRLAFLTGVLSRFEEYCGLFRPDSTQPFNKPVQHTIHTRVTRILDWILDNIWDNDGSCANGLMNGGRNNSSAAPTTAPSPFGNSSSRPNSNSTSTRARLSANNSTTMRTG